MAGFAKNDVNMKKFARLVKSANGLAAKETLNYVNGEIWQLERRQYDEGFNYPAMAMHCITILAAAIIVDLMEGLAVMRNLKSSVGAEFGLVIINVALLIAVVHIRSKRCDYSQFSNWLLTCWFAISGAIGVERAADMVMARVFVGFTSPIHTILAAVGLWISSDFGLIATLMYALSLDREVNERQLDFLYEMRRMLEEKLRREESENENRNLG